MGSGIGESQPSIYPDPAPLLLPSSSSATSEPYPSPISFVPSPRPFRDLPLASLFLLLSLSTLSLGLFALFRRNPDATRADLFYFDPSTSSCVLSDPRLSSSHFSSSSSFVKDLTLTLVATFLLAAPIALALLWILRRYTKQVVYAAVPFFVLTPALLNAYWFAACTLAEGCRAAFPLAYRVLVLVFVFVLVAIILWIVVANWSRVELTIHIVRVAAAALAENLALLAVLPLLGLGLLVYFAPIVVFLVFATWNGEVVAREREGARGERHYACVWKQDAWVPAYFALAIITMVWSAATMVEAKVYVISGTIAQWYFAKEGTRPTKSLRSSLRNAFGPSFGTICFSGMVMGAVRFVRAVVDSANQENETRGFVNLVLKCCANFLFLAFDFVNKFTINFAAITGEAYCSAARTSYDLLKRNLLSAVFVETVSTRVLIGIIFVLSAFYAIVVCAILKAVSALGVKMYLVAALAWLLLMVVLGYFVHVLDNVVDTVYVCYAIDRDKGEVNKQDVHEVYVQLPLSRNHRPPLSSRSPLIV
ncbi:CTL-like protein DDB_G0288717 [Ananas comosus]|uniref:Choline transporter-like protein n=1 Tax=Ananas comosus TaxID=4615 RepID=A0A6P5EN85_ANACO|nr:CTL-like protein DDB_G0288717 [Ananas comosus]